MDNYAVALAALRRIALEPIGNERPATVSREMLIQSARTTLDAMNIRWKDCPDKDLQYNDYCC